MKSRKKALAIRNLTEEQLKDLSAIEEIIFVGYPDSLRDEVNMTPITRRGITSTPLDQDFNGEPVFLIDASVFGGSSGSPVFILNQGSYTTPKALKVGTRIIFLGIVAESHYFFEKGKFLDKISALWEMPSVVKNFFWVVIP